MVIALKAIVGVVAIVFGCLQVYLVLAAHRSVDLGGLVLTRPQVEVGGVISIVVLCILFYPEITTFLRSRFG